MRDADLLRAKLLGKPTFRIVPSVTGPQIVCPTCKDVMVEGNAARIQVSVVECPNCRTGGSAA